MIRDAIGHHAETMSPYEAKPRPVQHDKSARDRDKQSSFIIVRPETRESYWWHGVILRQRNHYQLAVAVSYSVLRTIGEVK